MVKFFKTFSVCTFEFSFSQGQTLIETLAALAIISIVIVAIATSVTSSLSNAEYNDNQTLATKYAQQGMEVITQIRDGNYTNFKNYAGIYCLGKGSTTLGAAQVNCTTKNVDNFIRSVQIQQNTCAANVAKITVNVAFIDGKCQSGVFCHNENDVSCLSVLNPVQTP